jgi:tetratricopeptide (TPR) repeat protein
MSAPRPNLRQRLAHARAWLQLLLGLKDAAERTYGELLHADPDDAHARASRAHLRSSRRDFPAAIDDYQDLLNRHPERSGADWFNFGYLLEEAGRFEEAEAAFRRAVALSPQLDRAWYGLGLVLIRLQRLDEAVAALKRNTELQPMSPYGWYQLARVHIDRAKPDEALKIIRHLRGFEPKVADQLVRETGLQA